MKPLPMHANRVLEQLTSGLNKPGDHRTINNAEGFMPVHVEHVAVSRFGPVFSVAHYYEQNGDLMRDPEMLFVLFPGGFFYPVYFRQDGGLAFEQEPVDLDAGTCQPAIQAELVTFANLWMRNIRHQQHLRMSVEVEK